MRMKLASAVLCLTFVAGAAQAQGGQPRTPAGPGTCSVAQVYFDFGLDQLDQPDLETMHALVGRLAGGPMEFVIVGHMDTAEAADPAMSTLSRRRAASVTAGFALRTPDGAYRISGLGASQPALETGPGVREPFNRRVDIRACRV